MKRRDFLKTGTMLTAAMSTANFWAASTFAKSSSKNELPFDFVAIMGGEPDVMFDKAMAQLGSIRQFVKPNQSVVVKPNIGWNTKPERAGDTNPTLVKQIVKHCVDAGAKDVYVVDNTADVWTKCYKNSGIERAAKEAGAKVVSGANHRYYQKFQVAKGRRLKETEVHELILESDVLINVPVLKHHIATQLTIGMKNLMGIVWDRLYWHANDLHQCVADFATAIKPTLTVIDGYRVIKRNGPTGVSNADVQTLKSLLVGVDPVALDSAATRLFGLQPDDIRYITLAHEMGVGTKELTSLKIKKIKL